MVTLFTRATLLSLRTKNPIAGPLEARRATLVSYGVTRPVDQQKVETVVTYPYEDLGPERFQELCQVLILQRFPRAQCMPIGMADGGRDAVVSRRGKDVTVFQVKFRRKTPLAKTNYQDYLDWLQEAVERELPTILRLASTGVKHYVLISNVPCSSHSGIGTRDKMLAWLSERMPDSMEVDVWWRDDLDRSIDPQWEIKRTFALTSSGSSIEALLAGMTAVSSVQSSRFLTVSKFLKSQYDRDAEIKFREADLPNQPLLSSYLDVEAELAFDEAGARKFFKYSQRLKRPQSDPGRPRYYYDSRQYTGASLLLQLAGTQELTRIVIEGAPGQGKSTLMQYTCQVHRARLLGKEIRSIPNEYRMSPILLPFRIDLRDLAAWFQGENPFGQAANIKDYPRSIEGFLAAMVHDASGGGSFSIDDFDTIIATTPTLLAFDGLDEVADIDTRTRIVDELVKCSSRLQEIGTEVRFAVTSRPSAFSAAPRFPDDRFTYISLSNLSRPLILDYTKKWMKTRKVEAEEALKLTNILLEKLREPHIAELARNSMQLAILLFLIWQQQDNLPEQRTSLYEKYIERFMIRESGKNRIMREHGGIILQLHGYLAWILHSRAEAGSQGNVSESELKQILRQYMQDVGYDELEIVDELFQGMTERFIALVSRVQGTWEFEVQPLREYFAAQHLYDTARMSRAGRETTGTKADRFDAISGNPYWFNVTRFFVGFFDKGELAYLLHQFRSEFTDGRYRRQTYPRSLANSIIADRVFAQNPAMGRELSRLITANPIGWYALASGDGTNVLHIPRNNGGNEIVQDAKKALEGDVTTHSSQVIAVLRNFADKDDVTGWWYKNLPERSAGSWLTWMLIGIELDVLRNLGESELLKIFSPRGCDVLDYGLAIRGSASRIGMDSVDCGLGILDYLKLGIYQPGRMPSDANVLELGNFIFHDMRYGRIQGFFGDSGFLNAVKRADTSDHLSQLYNLLLDIADRAKRDNFQWYERIAEIIEGHLGPCWLAVRSSLMHSLYPEGRRKIPHSISLLDPSEPLLHRISAAFDWSSDRKWWEESISECSGADDAQLMVAALACIADEEVLIDVMPQLVDFVRDLSPGQIIATLDTIASFQPRRNRVNVKRVDPREIDSPILLAATARTARLDQRQRLLIAGISLSSDFRVQQVLTEDLIDTCVGRIARTGRWVGTRESLVEYSKKCKGLRYGFSNWLVREFRLENPLDEAVVESVLEHPELYPAELVLLADRAALQQVSRTFPLVSELAIQDSWFDEKQAF